jgi:hypothetical protein
MPLLKQQHGDVATIIANYEHGHALNDLFDGLNVLTYVTIIINSTLT